MHFSSMPTSIIPKNNFAHASELEATAVYRAYFFGPFRVIHDSQALGEPVWRRNKAKGLLKWLLLNPGRLFSAAQLIEVFWPGVASVSGSRNLHVTINYLRHLLEPDLLSRQESRFLRRNKNNFYWFETDKCWWADIFALQQHQAAAKEAELCGDTKELIVQYREIVQYCKLGFLSEDAYEDTFSIYRRQYDYLYMQTLENLIHLCSKLCLFDEVFAYAHQALLVDPYCELAIKAIVNAYLQQGNTVGALRRLDDFQRLLKSDLGTGLRGDLLSLRRRLLK